MPIILPLAPDGGDTRSPCPRPGRSTSRRADLHERRRTTHPHQQPPADRQPTPDIRRQGSPSRTLATTIGAPLANASAMTGMAALNARPIFSGMFASSSAAPSLSTHGLALTCARSSDFWSFSPMERSLRSTILPTSFANASSSSARLTEDRDQTRTDLDTERLQLPLSAPGCPSSCPASSCATSAAVPDFSSSRWNMPIFCGPASYRASRARMPSVPATV